MRCTVCLNPLGDNIPLSDFGFYWEFMTGLKVHYSNSSFSLRLAVVNTCYELDVDIKLDFESLLFASLVLFVEFSLFFGVSSDPSPDLFVPDKYFALIVWAVFRLLVCGLNVHPFSKDWI